MSKTSRFVLAAATCLLTSSAAMAQTASPATGTNATGTNGKALTANPTTGTSETGMDGKALNGADLGKAGTGQDGKPAMAGTGTGMTGDATKPASGSSTKAP